MSYDSDELLAWVLGQKRRSAESGWIGKPMMNPEGNVGVVVEDDNGIAGGRYRHLTIEFRDGHQEVLVLANVGGNPTESRKWKNYFAPTKQWVPWGW